MKFPFPQVFSAVALMLAAGFSAAESPLTRRQAEETITATLAEIRAEFQTDLPEKLPVPIQYGIAAFPESPPVLKVEGFKMPYALIVKRADRKSRAPLPLFIALHGGGQNTSEPGPHTWQVNTREFQAQAHLAANVYAPDGIYFVPRMADDRLGRWWHRHNQLAFERVIDTAVLRWEADPARIYLLGISEGGFGTDILAPFMADRFAAANAMAAGVGLANPPANLRNLPFRTDIGENDNMFQRKALALAFHAELDRLHALDPQGYQHSIELQPGRGHGIDYSRGVKWIAQFCREPWPEKFTWVNQALDGRRTPRFHWLEIVTETDVRADASADRKTNSITLRVVNLSAANRDGNRTHGSEDVAATTAGPFSSGKIKLLMSDRLLDLDKPVTVVCNEKTIGTRTLARSRAVISSALRSRPDAATCPTAEWEITVP